MGEMSDGLVTTSNGTTLGERLAFMWSSGVVTTSSDLIEPSGGQNSTVTSTGGVLNDVVCDPSDERRVDRLLGASNMLLMIYPWVLVCTGTLTNSISFAVLTRPKLKKSSTFFYLACLCIIDLLSLYTFCINFICFYHFKVSTSGLMIFD